MSEWLTIPATEFCLSVRDGTHDTPKEVNVGGRRLVTSRNLKNGSLDFSASYKISESDFESINKRSKVDRWDVLFSMIGTVGQVVLIQDEPDFAIKNIGLFKSKSELAGKWLYYYLRSPTTRQIIEGMLRGTTQQYIPLGALRLFPISYPSNQSEMVAIAHILGTLDDKIDQLRKTNSVLEDMASALFKSWFVDFDPVKAKQENRPTGLPKDLDDLFPDSFEDSALGPIPTGWRVGCVGDVAINVQKSISSNNLTSDMNYVALEHMPRKSLQLHDWGNAGEVASNKSSFQAGDILFGKLRPYFHKVVIAPVDGVCSTDILVTRPAESDWHGFVTMHMFSDELVKYSDSTSNGTRMPRTSWSVIKCFTISVPPKSIACQFNMMVDPSWKRASSNIHQIRTVTNLRDTLLPKLISGQLRVPDAEQMVAELGL